MFFRLAIVVVLAAVAVLALVWFWPPNVSLAARQDSNGAIRFALRPNFRVNGLLKTAVWRENSPDYLWLLDINYAPVDEITYGVVPPTKNASRQSVVQRVPTDGSLPAPILIGETFYVEVTFQFDSAVPPAACMGHRFFRCRLNADGSVDAEPVEFAERPKNHPPPLIFRD